MDDLWDKLRPWVMRGCVGYITVAVILFVADTLGIKSAVAMLVAGGAIASGLVVLGHIVLYYIGHRQIIVMYAQKEEEA